MNKILLEDLEYIASSVLPWDRLDGETVLVTGSTGFLGSLLIKALDHIRKKHSLDIKILAFCRNEKEAYVILKDCKVSLIQGDIRSLPSIPYDIGYIFHCAASTKSKEMIESPVEVSGGIVNGTQNILQLAEEKHIKSMVYLSSMEVYGQFGGELRTVCEETLGHVDILRVRSCYPLGKRMAENLCCSYCSEYGVPVKTARLAQVFGPGILSKENRVFAQFAKSVVDNENIVLHTDGESYGNYCYTADAVIGLFTLLFYGESGQAYNISNEDTNMTIRQMADLVAAKIAQGRISVVFDIPGEDSFGYAPPSKIKLSSEKLRRLGWKPKFGIEEMYERMIIYMAEG